jgi:hypothetical protein
LPVKRRIFWYDLESSAIGATAWATITVKIAKEAGKIAIQRTFVNRESKVD